MKRFLIIIAFILSTNFTQGQQLFKDIFPSSTDAFPVYSFPFCNSNGVFYFDAVGSSSFGSELWKSDGTADGTVLVKDIAPGVNSSVIRNLTNVNGIVFFRARTDANNSTFELWKTDGTTDGTTMVKDIVPGTNGSNPLNLMLLMASFFSRQMTV